MNTAIHSSYVYSLHLFGAQVNKLMMDTCRSTMLDLLVVLAIAAVLSCSVFQYASAQASCGRIGTLFPQVHATSRSAKFYLSVGDPAPCRGCISFFTFCYYRPVGTINSNDNYISNFAIYRKNSETDSYDIISPVYVAERSTSDLKAQLGVNFIAAFHCADYTLNEPVFVEVGDVVGACVFDPSGGSIKQLDIVGDGTVSSVNSMLMRTGTNGCNINSVPSTVTSASLEDSSTLVLHLYASFIVPIGTDCQPPPATTAASTMENIPVTTAATTMENVPATTTDDTVTPTEVTTATDTTTTTNTPVTTITDSNTPTTDPVTDSEQTTLATTLLETTIFDQPEAAGNRQGVSAGTIAPVVVVVLTVLLVSVAIIVVIIVLWTRKQRLTKKSYPVAGASGVGQYEEMDYENSTVADRPETTANLEMRPIQSDSI